jgi:hypothetical protein
MDQAPDSASNDPRAAALSSSWEAWEKYYREASQRRHAQGSNRQLREEKRRRRIRERVGLAVSAALVSGLTLIFYFVLTHR